MSSWKDLKAELLKDPETAAKYEELKPEYDFIRQIIQARKEQNLTQAELAKRCNMKQSNISRLESGEYNPSLEFMAKVARAVGKELRITLVEAPTHASPPQNKIS
jgi:transcriptional regulator with XRE-family HTH domain